MSDMQFFQVAHLALFALQVALVLVACSKLRKAVTAREEALLARNEAAAAYSKSLAMVMQHQEQLAAWQRRLAERTASRGDV